ncbi:dUTP diphosphatase [Planctomycetota bacterium]
MTRIRIKKIRDSAVTPHYEHEGDAGMDLYSALDSTLGPGERRLIPTGIKAEVPRGYEMQIRPKSGLALKRGVTVLNTPGTVDAGYRGEVGVILFNTSDEDVEIKAGEKVAQAVICKVETAIIEEVEELSETGRGAKENGYSSARLWSGQDDDSLLRRSSS